MPRGRANGWGPGWPVTGTESRQVPAGSKTRKVPGSEHVQDHPADVPGLGNGTEPRFYTGHSFKKVVLTEIHASDN